MRHKLTIALPMFVIAGLMVLVAAASAGTYNIIPTDDVSCRSDYPNTQGTPAASLLYVGGPIVSTNDYWTTFIKFDLSQFASGTINSATLYLTCQSHSSGGLTVSTYEVTSDPYDWDEYWMSQQTADTTLVVSTSPTANTTVNATDTAFAFSVTASAQSHKGGDLTIVVKEQSQPNNGKWAKFYSKDNSTSASYRPYLSVNYTPPAEDDGYIGHIDFDPSISIDNLATPGINDPFDAFITLELLNDGMTSCAFSVNVPPETASDVTFENLLPDGFTEGEWDTGVLVGSSSCVGNAGDLVSVGVLHMVYQGTPGDIMLLSHPDYPEMVIDCQSPGQIQTFCVMSHGGVNKAPLDGDCVVTPAEDKTWTSIKALYR